MLNIERLEDRALPSFMPVMLTPADLAGIPLQFAQPTLSAPALLPAPSHPHPIPPPQQQPAVIVPLVTDIIAGFHLTDRNAVSWTVTITDLSNGNVVLTQKRAGPVFDFRLHQKDFTFVGSFILTVQETLSDGSVVTVPGNDYLTNGIWTGTKPS